MKTKAVSVMILTLLLTSLLTLAFNVQSPKAETYETRLHVRESPPGSWIPGVPVGEWLLVTIDIESPIEWDNSAEGIVGWVFSVQVDPDVLEPIGAVGASFGYFLYDFVDWNMYWGHEPQLLVAEINSTTGDMVDVGELIMGFETLGVGAGGNSYPGSIYGSEYGLCRLRFKSKSETAHTLIDVYDAYLVRLNASAPEGYSKIPFDVVDDAHYNEPPPLHTLTVESTPIDGIDFTVDSGSYTTNATVGLEEGSYTVTMPDPWRVGISEYFFRSWEDNSTNPVRSISITADRTITAKYGPPIPYNLTVNSEPITGINFKIDVVATHTTNWTGLVLEGDRLVEMPATWTTPGGDVYRFDHWENNSTYRFRDISVKSDMTITATYELYEPVPPPVTFYASMPADGYIPGVPPGNPIDVEVWIESPHEWTNTSNGIVGWAFYVYADPEVLEPVTVTGATNEYFLYDFAYGHEYSTAILFVIDKEAGLFKDIAEFIMGWETLGVGAGGSGKLCTLRFTSLSETAYTKIDLYNVYYYTTAGGEEGKVPVDVVVDGHYNQPPIGHSLTVESTPIDGIDFTTDSTGHTTNATVELEEGSYTVTMPSTWTVGPDQYNFVEWEDASTNPVRSISLTSNTTIVATYELSVYETRLHVRESPPGSWIPGVPVGEWLLLTIDIESPIEWDNSADGIVGCVFSVHVDPDVLEPIGAVGASFGYFLYDFVDWNMYWGHEPQLLVKEINPTTGDMVQVGELIMGFETLGVGAGGSSYPGSLYGSTGGLCRLRFKSKSETAHTLIDIYDAFWVDTNGVKHAFDVVDDGQYNTLTECPVAIIEGPPQGYVNTPVTFVGSYSYDPDGGPIVSYLWDFGDGTVISTTNPTIVHTYTAIGTYEVALAVTDDEGQVSDPATHAIEIKEIEDPVEATQELIETIETSNFSEGTKNSLTPKLYAVIHLLDKGNKNGAVRKLMDFIDQVEALRKKKLTDEQADNLISEAQRIINLING